MHKQGLRLLMFNLMTDIDDPVLGFTSLWIRELAAYCQSIDVLTMYQGRRDLPENVRVFSAGRERGLSKPMRVAMFYRQLLPLLATHSYDACFAHMMPLFAGLAGPFLTLRGIPQTLWYTHREKSRQLELGLRASKRIVTAVPTSFPYASDKIRVIGHGIDTDYFAPATTQPIDEPPLIVQVARLAEIKHQETVIRALAKLDAHLLLIGDVQAGYPQAYKEKLQKLVDELNMHDRVTFAGDVPGEAALEWYRKASLAVNMSPVGLFDKAALESMACAIPTIVCNPAFTNLMGDFQSRLLVSSPDDVEGLAQRIASLLSMPVPERDGIGQHLRAGVIQHHSLKTLIVRLVEVLQTGEFTPAQLTSSD